MVPSHTDKEHYPLTVVYKLRHSTGRRRQPTSVRYSSHQQPYPKDKSTHGRVTRRINPESGKVSNEKVEEEDLEILHQPNSHRKQVSFGAVQIRLHPIILSDHPGVSTGGPPVGIDWTYQTQMEVPLDLYERFLRKPCRKNKIRSRARILSREERSLILFRAGVSTYEMAEATLQARLIQRQRIVTASLWKEPSTHAAGLLSFKPPRWEGWRSLLGFASRTLLGRSRPSEEDLQPKLVSAKTA